MPKRFVAIGILGLVVILGLSSCKSNDTGTFVPMGTERWAGREIVLDTRTGQVWVLEDGAQKGRYVRRYWIEYCPPIEEQNSTLWGKITGIFKHKEVPPPPPPPPEAAPIED